MEYRTYDLAVNGVGKETHCALNEVSPIGLTNRLFACCFNSVLKYRKNKVISLLQR